MSLLEQARAEGHVLVRRIDTDSSLKLIMREYRALIAETERAEALLALECVDRVVIYDEETPLATINSLRPDVLVKGADWAIDKIVGREEVESLGGRVVRVELLPDRSTTGLIRKAEGRTDAPQ